MQYAPELACLVVAFYNFWPDYQINDDFTPRMNEALLPAATVTLATRAQGYIDRAARIEAEASVRRAKGLHVHHTADAVIAEMRGAATDLLRAYNAGLISDVPSGEATRILQRTVDANNEMGQLAALFATDNEIRRLQGLLAADE